MKITTAKPLTKEQLERLKLLMVKKRNKKEEAEYRNLKRKAHWSFFVKNREDNTKEKTE